MPPPQAALEIMGRVCWLKPRRRKAAEFFWHFFGGKIMKIIKTNKSLFFYRNDVYYGVNTPITRRQYHGNGSIG